MADPLSTAESAGALLTLCKKAIEIVNDIRNATKEQAELRESLGELQNIIDTTKLNQDMHSKASAPGVEPNCPTVAARKLQDILKKFSDAPHPNSRWRRWWRMVTWPYKKAKFAKARQEIESLKLTLSWYQQNNLRMDMTKVKLGQQCPTPLTRSYLRLM